MPLFATIILISFIESLVAFAGGLFVILGYEKIRRAAHFMVSFAVGALLGVAILHLIPEAIEMAGVESIMPFVLAGIVFFFILEKSLFWYHCHGGVCPAHTYTYLVLWGDFVHNFVDGVIIALAFLTDFQLGLLVAIAVILHEIPQEIGDFSILITGGLSRKKAFIYNYFSASSVVIGAAAAYFLGAWLLPFLPFAIAVIAGNFIYLASADLMPELHEVTSLRHGLIQVLFIIIGALAVILPDFIGLAE